MIKRLTKPQREQVVGAIQGWIKGETAFDHEIPVQVECYLDAMVDRFIDGSYTDDDGAVFMYFASLPYTVDEDGRKENALFNAFERIAGPDWCYEWEHVGADSAKNGLISHIYELIEKDDSDKEVAIGSMSMTVSQIKNAWAVDAYNKMENMSPADAFNCPDFQDDMQVLIYNEGYDVETAYDSVLNNLADTILGR